MAVGRGEGYGRRGDGRLARPGCATRGSPTSSAATRGSGATQGAGATRATHEQG